MAAPQIPGAIPDWLGNEFGGNDWNGCILGDVILAGIVSVHQFKCGIEVDTKKAKGSDQPTSRDNGLDPAKFKIRVHMNASHWPEFQLGLPSINPRRPGRDRQPLQIIQPWVNALGVTQVRVISIEADQPTARRGFTVEIEVEEWFDKPKEKPKKKEKPVPAVAAQRAHTLGFGLVNDGGPSTIEELDPSVTDSLSETMFPGVYNPTFRRGG